MLLDALVLQHSKNNDYHVLLQQRQDRFLDQYFFKVIALNPFSQVDVIFKMIKRVSYYSETANLLMSESAIPTGCTLHVVVEESAHKLRVLIATEGQQPGFLFVTALCSRV